MEQEKSGDIDDVCWKCKGSGKMTLPYGEYTCDECEGWGYGARGEPYQHTVEWEPTTDRIGKFRHILNYLEQESTKEQL
jgi:DnaJ-class molecular chaperone